MAYSEFVPVEAVGLGIDRNQDSRLNFVPDFSGLDLSMTDFGQVRRHLSLSPHEPLHILSDLDMTLRDNDAPDMHEGVVANIQAQLASDVITSFHIATNSRHPDIMRIGEQISPDTQVFAPIISKEGRIIRKPNPVYYEQILGTLGITGEEKAIAVGDKYMRDILGGNRANLLTLHVQPLPGPELWHDRVGGRRVDTFAGWLGRRALARLTPRTNADPV